MGGVETEAGGWGLKPRTGGGEENTAIRTKGARKHDGALKRL